jgi:hypothetical protein
MNPATTQPAAPREKSVWPMFVGAFVLFVLFAAFVLWMLRSGDVASYDEEAIRAKERYEILAKVQEENNNLTSGYAWADQAKGTVRIPVAQAMELAVTKLSAQGEPRPAYPIDPNAPLGSALKPGGLAAPQPTPPPFGAPPEPAPAPAAEPPTAPEEAPAP